LKIKDIPVLYRPRERALSEGISNLSTEELFTILIQKGSKGFSARDVALELIKKCPTSSDLLNLSMNQLLEIKGIGKAKATEILSAIELGKRLYLNEFNEDKILLKTAEDIYRYMKYVFYQKKQEYFYCIYLNPHCEVIERRLLFMGTMNRSVVHPREIFKYAYLNSAASIVCVHNHPSGTVNPSVEDIHLTESIVKLGRINAIPVVDHVIVGDSSYYSFYEEGKILNL